MTNIINPFWNPYGGSERRALRLYREFRDNEWPARLWAGHWEPVAPALQEEYPIHLIRPKTLSIPFRGTCVFVGMYFGYGRWLWLSRPKRIIVVCNIISQDFLDARIEELKDLGMYARTEFVYASDLVREWAGRPGRVEISPIDLSKFHPPDRTTRSDNAPFTVGRLSRDDPRKHHPDDPSFYRECLEAGMRVRILGGTCLTDQLGPHPNLELLPAGSVEADVFLRSLDCFYYRTDPVWTEPHGRVVTEAMATGLPVVCHRRGGYTELIEDGTSGYLFDTTSQALKIVDALHTDETRRAAVGRAARRESEEWFSTATRNEWLRYYAA